MLDDGDAVARVGRVRRGAGRGREGRQPIHRNHDLAAGRARRHAARPAEQCRDAQAAFEQVRLLAREGPGIGETLAAIVAREDHDRVPGHAGTVERIEHAADLLVQAGHDSRIGFLVAAVEIAECLRVVLGRDAGRLGRVRRPFPGPVRGREMQAHEEGLVGRREVADEPHRVVAEEIGEIAGLVGQNVFVPQRVIMVEVVGRAAADPVIVLVAAFERPVVRKEAEVPLADQGRVVALGAQQRRQRGMRWGEPRHVGGQRLFEADREPILVASGDQRRAGRRADGRVRISLGEAKPVLRDTVDVRGREVRAAVAGQIRVAHVVGQDEEDVGRLAGCLGRRVGRRRPVEHRQSQAAAGPGQKRASRDLRHAGRLPWCLFNARNVEVNIHGSLDQVSY